MRTVIAVIIILLLLVVSFFIMTYLHRIGPYVSYISYDYGISDSEINRLNEAFINIDSNWQPVIFKERGALKIYFFDKSTFKDFPKELSLKVIQEIDATASDSAR